MKKQSWLCILGAALVLSAAPSVFSAARSAPAQTSTSKAKKKKASAKSSKSRAKSKKGSKTKAQTVPTPDRIKEIQSALKREGVYDGDATGNWDAATADALRNFQDKNGINPTGKIDALSLEKLGLGSATAGKSAPSPTASASPAPSPAPSPTGPPVANSSESPADPAAKQ